MEMVRRLRLKAMIPRLRRDEEEQERFPDAADETVVLQQYDEERRTPSRGGSTTRRRRRHARQPIIRVRRPRAGRRTFPVCWRRSATTPDDGPLGRPPRTRTSAASCGSTAGWSSVLTEAGPLRASVGGGLLGRMAQDPTEGPCTGDWCVLREWPDHRLDRSSGCCRGAPRSCARPRASRATARCSAPTWTSRGRGRAAPAAGAGQGRAAGRAGLGERRPARWWCSPRPTWSPTPTWSPRTSRDAAPGVEVVVVSSVTGRGRRRAARAGWRAG